MGYDLFIRAERAHTTYARIADLRPLCEACGLVPNGTGWLLDRDGRWMEIYLSTVTEGAGAGDAIDGDGERFNEVQCHPRPYDRETLAIVMRLAARLRWQLYDPQTGRTLRDAGAIAVEPGFAPAARGEVMRVGRDGWAGPAEAIEIIDDETILVSSHAGRGSPSGLERRLGPKLALERRISETHPPVIRSPDRRLLLVHGPSEPAHVRPETIEVRDPTTLALVRSLPLRAPAWLPDRPATFVAIMHRADRFARLVAADVATGETTSFEPHVLLGADSQYVHAKVAVSGDGAHVAVIADYWLHVFSARTGTLLRRHQLDAHHVRSFATHGSLLAMTALPRDANGDAVVVIDLADGRFVARLPSAALGTSSHPETIAFHPSGWLAIGFGNGGVMALGLDGSSRSLHVASGSVRALAFTPDGSMLLAAGATDGILRIPLLDDERRASTAPHPVPATDPLPFSFAETPTIFPTEVELLLRCPLGVEAMVAQLLRLPGDVDAELARTSGSFPHRAQLLAMARRARQAGRTLDPRWHAAVVHLAHWARPEEFAMAREILEVVPDAHALVFARRDQPIWRRFQLLPSPAALDLLVEIIRGLPKGAYTQLKAAGGDDFECLNGYSAKEFQQGAIAALASYGASAIPVLERALDGKFATRKWFEEALAQLRTER